LVVNSGSQARAICSAVIPTPVSRITNSTPCSGGIEGSESDPEDAAAALSVNRPPFGIA